MWAKQKEEEVVCVCVWVHLACPLLLPSLSSEFPFSLFPDHRIRSNLETLILLRCLSYSIQIQYLFVSNRGVVVMDDYPSSDDEYPYSDQEDSYDDAFENDDQDYQSLASKGPTPQVFYSFLFDFLPQFFRFYYIHTYIRN